MSYLRFVNSEDNFHSPYVFFNLAEPVTDLWVQSDVAFSGIPSTSTMTTYGLWSLPFDTGPDNFIDAIAFEAESLAAVLLTSDPGPNFWWNLAGDDDGTVSTDAVVADQRYRLKSHIYWEGAVADGNTWSIQSWIDDVDIGVSTDDFTVLGRTNDAIRAVSIEAAGADAPVE